MAPLLAVQAVAAVPAAHPRLERASCWLGSQTRWHRRHQRRPGLRFSSSHSRRAAGATAAAAAGRGCSTLARTRPTRPPRFQPIRWLRRRRRHRRRRATPSRQLSRLALPLHRRGQQLQAAAAHPGAHSLSLSVAARAAQAVRSGFCHLHAATATAMPTVSIGRIPAVQQRCQQLFLLLVRLGSRSQDRWPQRCSSRPPPMPSGGSSCATQQSRRYQRPTP